MSKDPRYPGKRYFWDAKRQVMETRYINSAEEEEAGWFDSPKLAQNPPAPPRPVKPAKVAKDDSFGL